VIVVIASDHENQKSVAVRNTLEELFLSPMGEKVWRFAFPLHRYSTENP
jgi:hypothetical protein